jgi:hypothetical protein
VPPSAARCASKVVVEPIDDLDRARILEQRPPGARRRGTSAEIPEQRFRYSGQIGGDPLHPGMVDLTADDHSPGPPRHCLRPALPITASHA